MKNKGFTLVELSIALVIVGLLIGGILIGQSLVESAKINALVRQIQEADIAISNFRQKYKGLPGDSSKFNSSGNNNGMITDSINNDDHFNGEIANFWKNLSESGFGKTIYSTNNLATTGVVYDTHIPSVKLGKDSGLVVGYVAEGYDVQYGKNVYAIAKWLTAYTNVFANVNLSTSLSAPHALSVDQKIDDGLPDTGTTRAFGQPGYIELGNSPTANCRNGGRYVTASTIAYPCGLQIVIEASTGQNN